MAYHRPTITRPHLETDQPERMSQNGHLLGVGIYGFLMLVGFMFGIVTGYEPQRTVIKADQTNKDTAKANTPAPPKEPTKITPDNGTPTPLPKNDTPPSKTEPPKVEPPKVEPPKKETTSSNSDPMPPKKDPPMVAVKPVSFQKDVLPIFRTYCLNCHGAAGTPKGDVDLRTLDAIKKGGGGPILEIGKPEKSAIYTSMTDGAMPPKPPRPTKGELDVIRNWILTGANPRRAIRTRRRLGRR